MGKRNRARGARMLSEITCLKRIFPLSFIPPVPYPPLRGTFPSRGRLTIREYRQLKYGEAATSIPHFPYGLSTKKDVMTLSHRDIFFRKH